ncbi:unnamed protein product [Paramecium octaurelia]|uniref:Uncharacterized protein n=1 Tax=Paramecium octaurelia TaxID=43137 RepID=A0A8S1W8G0_PAROT|nr:unnamed protein product [Paramecium octaurelia]
MKLFASFIYFRHRNGQCSEQNFRKKNQQQQKNSQKINSRIIAICLLRQNQTPQTFI